MLLPIMTPAHIIALAMIVELVMIVEAILDIVPPIFLTFLVFKFPELFYQSICTVII